MSPYKLRENRQVSRGKQLRQTREKRNREKFQCELHKTLRLDRHHTCVCLLVSMRMGRSICNTVQPQHVVKGHEGGMR